MSRLMTNKINLFWTNPKKKHSMFTMKLCTKPKGNHMLLLKWIPWLKTAVSLLHSGQNRTLLRTSFHVNRKLRALLHTLQILPSLSLKSHLKLFQGILHAAAIHSVAGVTVQHSLSCASFSPSCLQREDWEDLAVYVTMLSRSAHSTTSHHTEPMPQAVLTDTSSSTVLKFKINIS